MKKELRYKELYLLQNFLTRIGNCGTYDFGPFFLVVPDDPLCKPSGNRVRSCQLFFKEGVGTLEFCLDI